MGGNHPMNKEFKKQFGLLLSGLQVPLSLGALGAARDPLCEIRRLLHLHGYHTAAEAESAIENATEKRGA